MIDDKDIALEPDSFYVFDYCPACGSPVTQGAARCNECGQLLKWNEEFKERMNHDG